MRLSLRRVWLVCPVDAPTFSPETGGSGRWGEGKDKPVCGRDEKWEGGEGGQEGGEDGRVRGQRFGVEGQVIGVWTE